MYTLGQLHAELAGKLLDNKREAKRLTVAMMQVEAVMKMLEPGYNVRAIAVRRRHALDALRGAQQPMTVREIVMHMLAAKGATDATPKRIRDLGGAVQAALRDHRGEGVIQHDRMRPTRWSV
jgi:hypothetical protein